MKILAFILNPSLLIILVGPIALGIANKSLSSEIYEHFYTIFSNGGTPSTGSIEMRLANGISAGTPECALTELKIQLFTIIVVWAILVADVGRWLAQHMESFRGVQEAKQIISRVLAPGVCLLLFGLVAIIYIVSTISIDTVTLYVSTCGPSIHIPPLASNITWARAALFCIAIYFAAMMALCENKNQNVKNR